MLSNGVKLLIFHIYATNKLKGIRKCLNCGAKSFLLFQSIDAVDTYSARFWFAFESTFYFRVEICINVSTFDFLTNSRFLPLQKIHDKQGTKKVCFNDRSFLYFLLKDIAKFNQSKI